MPVTNRTNELFALCKTDMSHAKVLETTYTCRCGSSEYNDVVFVYSRDNQFKMPRVTDCPLCDGREVEVQTHDEWAAGKIHKMLNTRKGLYIWGSYGTMKTTSAERIRNEAGVMKLSVSMLTSSRFLDKVKDTQGTFERVTDIIDTYAAKDLLIIDDIGNEPLSEYNLSKLRDLVDARYRVSRPTVYTSNYERDELIRRYAQVNDKLAKSLGSRIAGTTDKVPMNGEDRRLA